MQVNKCFNCDEPIVKERFRFCDVCVKHIDCEKRRRLVAEATFKQCQNCNLVKRRRQFKPVKSEICSVCSNYHNKFKTPSNSVEKSITKCIEELKLADNIGSKAIAYGWCYFCDLDRKYID